MPASIRDWVASPKAVRGALTDLAAAFRCDDILIGRSGADQFDGDAGNDTLRYLSLHYSMLGARDHHRFRAGGRRDRSQPDRRQSGDAGRRRLCNRSLVHVAKTPRSARWIRPAATRLLFGLERHNLEARGQSGATSGGRIKNTQPSPTIHRLRSRRFQTYANLRGVSGNDATLAKLYAFKQRKRVSATALPVPCAFLRDAAYSKINRGRNHGHHHP